MAARRKRRKKTIPKAKAAEAPAAAETPEDAAGAEASEEKADEKKARATKSAAAAAYQSAAGAGDKKSSVDTAADGEGETVPISTFKETEKERDTYLDLARRTQADFENYKKRVQKEAADRKRQVLGGFLKECLPAICDLNRVITEGENAHDYETLHTGVKLMRDNLWKVMKNAGIVEIESLGKPFDPQFHEAMAMVPSPDHEPNTVMEVFQPGYMLDEEVIAHARVIVAAAQ